MSAVPIKIEWDSVPEADTYVVYYQSEGEDFRVETSETSVVLQLPERRLTLIYVTSRRGQLESISSEEMVVYPTRWNR